MAVSPAFTATPRIGRGSVTTASSNIRSGAGTNYVDVITGVAAGTRINEIVIKSTGQPADSVLGLLIFDGTNTYLFDEVDLGAPAAGSNTVTAYRTSVFYTNLILPSASYKIQAAVSVTPTSGTIEVIALAGDF